MGIVAESVETHQQMLSLTELGVTHLQGYLFSEPRWADAVPSMLASQNHFVGAASALESPEYLDSLGGGRSDPAL
jgi:predicted signal transduction protein with EAL and GGDEF domain